MTNIDPKDIKPGDRVRMIVAREGVVSEVDAEGFVSFGGWCFPGAPADLGLMQTLTWELIERPKPEAKLGSVWVDPEVGARWVALEGGWYAAADGGRFVGPHNDWGRAIIARLVPAEEQA